MFACRGAMFCVCEKKKALIQNRKVPLEWQHRREAMLTNIKADLVPILIGSIFGKGFCTLASIIDYIFPRLVPYY
jgi:hypothetical protein